MNIDRQFQSKQENITNNLVKMKQEKILIWQNQGQKQDFKQSVNNAMQKANDLINAYNSFQDFAKIETLQEFEALHGDPLGMFDETILQNIDISAKGNKQPDPAVLASLFQIDRTGFMAATGQSEPVKDADCPDCQKKTQSIKVKNVKSNAEFSRYAEYMVFINGSFVLNNSAIETRCNEFNIYAESPEQIALFNHWQSVCNILNQHDRTYNISPSGKDQIAKALKLQLSEGIAGKFVTNNISLSEQIKYMK